MRIGILGTGDVGKALGRGFAALGHEVKMGSRDAKNEKALAWAKEVGAKASVGSFGDAAAYGDLVVLATLGEANESCLRAAGPDRLRSKVVIDATNPLDFSKGAPPTLAVSGHDPGGERVQRLLPGAQVVKAFNTVGHPHMFRPQFPGGPPDMFICGNDKAAKSTVGGLLKGFGWGVVDIGGIESSRYLEAMCLVWVLHAVSTAPPTFNHAFKMLRK
jgi:8-hydroxy-5-deazaflavin:NADPH oxidoreductase